jgi:hypothetical protein
MPKRIKTFMDGVVGLYERNNKHTRVGFRRSALLVAFFFAFISCLNPPVYLFSLSSNHVHVCCHCRSSCRMMMRSGSGSELLLLLFLFQRLVVFHDAGER